MSKRDPGELNLFSIPADVAFIPTLTTALLDGVLCSGFDLRGDPLLLSDTTIFVPTQRAVPVVQAEFLSQLGNDGALMPRIRALGQFDDTELVLDQGADTPIDRVGTARIPPQVDPVERRLALTRLALAWADSIADGGDDPIIIPASPADACRLAGDLERLLDDAIVEQVPWSGLTELVPDDLAHYWQLTLRFLQILTEFWPAHLDEKGVIDAADRRNLLLAAYSTQLAAQPPQAPVIIAGSTGTVGATAELMKTVAGLTAGAVVLPGLDKAMDDGSWEELSAIDDGVGDGLAGHPQAGMHRLLARFGVSRDDVRQIGERHQKGEVRTRIISEAMRPATTTDQWRISRDRLDPADMEIALGDISYIDARHQREEALAVALALREAVATGITAALVTPDRGLARRVAGELRRWDLRVDDDAGTPLSLTPAGTLVRLVARLAFSDVAPVDLLALLKHPLAFLGQPASDIRAAARTLELMVLRGPRPGNTLADIENALAAVTKSDDQTAAGAVLMSSLRQTLAPLIELAGAERVDTAAVAADLRDVIAVIGAPDPDAGTDHIFSTQGGRVLLSLLEQLATSGGAGLQVRPGAFPDLLDVFLAEKQVRGPTSGRRDIQILGVLEARLQDPDLIILAGLNEGIWPADTRLDPWLSRPMRHNMALSAPERRIGLAAHDFAQAMGRRRVLLTRAQRTAGAPAIESRWLQRLFAFIGDQATEEMTMRGNRYRDLARHLDAAPTGGLQPVARPNPKPPLAARPTQTSVTEVETWIRDAYAVYARRVLNLRQLDPIDADPGPADRGNLIHDILNTFCQTWTGPYDETAISALTEIGRQAFQPQIAMPQVAAFWWPRFKRIARWFVLEFEQPRRQQILKIASEVAGDMDLSVDGQSFRLIGRADRIEQWTDGRLALHDYKTGQVPSNKQVESNLAPQLPLETLMAAKNAFADVAAGQVGEIAYVRLTGALPPASLEIRGGKTPLADLAADAENRLHDLVRHYRDPDNGYLSRGRPRMEGEMSGPYDHLARTREWAIGGGEEP